MAIPAFTITCTRKALIAPDVYELAFTKPEGLAYKAGQFVLFDIPHPDDANNIQARAYTISSAPHEPELLFVIKLKDGGRASRWVEKKVQIGTSVVIKGPFGVFSLKPEETADCVFIATGAGIAPFRSIIADMVHFKNARRADVLFCVRTEQDFFWIDVFKKFVSELPNVGLHLCLSQPHDGWAGLSGRVQTALPQIVPNLVGKKIYICGNPDMTTDMKKLCLDQWGVSKQDLHIEGYI